MLLVSELGVLVQCCTTLATYVLNHRSVNKVLGVHLYAFLAFSVGQNTGILSVTITNH